MISKEDWQNAYHDVLDDGRKRVGPPPAPEEVEALFEGRLEGAEADRVRERLAYYPEMVRAMTAEFPEAADDVLSDADVEADLANIRARVGIAVPVQPSTVVPLRTPKRRILAIAAGIVIALAAGSLVMQRWMREPRSIMTVRVYPRTERGSSPSAPAQLSKANDYVLQAVPAIAAKYREYRVELFDLTTEPAEKVWTTKDAELQADGTIAITLPTTDLDPGLYRAVLYGVNGMDKPLGEYRLRLSAP
jgi:hypothetical protein